MKNIISIFWILALFAMSCEEPGADQVPEPLRLSKYIIGEWQYKIYPEGNQYYNIVFSDETYFVKYSDGERVLKSTSEAYWVNDESNEIQMVIATIRDYQKNRIYYVEFPRSKVEMTSKDIMTLHGIDGNTFIFIR